MPTTESTDYNETTQIKAREAEMQAWQAMEVNRTRNSMHLN